MATPSLLHPQYTKKRKKKKEIQNKVNILATLRLALLCSHRQLAAKGVTPTAVVCKFGFLDLESSPGGFTLFV